MEISIKSELQAAHNKIVLAQQKVDQLFKSGKSRRDEEVKYWMKQLGAWTDYANDLNGLAYHRVIILKRTIRGDGGTHVRIEKTNGDYIKWFDQKHLPSEIMESIAIGDDYSLNNPACKRCGALGTQLHHWAPKELFEDAEKWPQDYLCRDCHQRWHDIVTNKYRELRRKEQANEPDNVRIRPELSR